MKKLGFLLVALVVFVVQPVVAQTVPPTTAFPIQEMDRAPVDGENLVHAGAVGGGGTLSGAVVGPYKGYFASDPTQAVFNIFCVDFGNYVNTGSSGWAINATSMGVADDSFMDQTRLGTASGSLLKYQQAAFLATLFSADKTNWVAAHGAIWTIMGGGDFTGTTGVQAAMDYAGNSYSEFIQNQATEGAQRWAQMDFDRWYVMTPQDGENSQEFIGRVVTPEPTTVILLGSGLFIIGAAAYRRRKDEDLT